ncbi:MAG: SMC-Scp complex subunit ScpB [Clostridiales bacterium]|nr:SMC-Scp complex subunit ScpB [Clostridiales bacterium]MDD6389417.1 SMC-Scp complex subunit ScpB [Bacillota bacterium]
MTTEKTIKSALESLMFTWGEPLDAKIAAEAVCASKEDVLAAFRKLQEEYEQEQRGIRIREINGSFQFVTDIDNSDYIARLCTPVKVKRLSQSALEVLAIIAYRQPVTKVEIESIRGIRCDRVMEGLIAKGLVEDRGRSNAIGRPILYGTTDEFLRYFGLSSIRELPEIEDIEEALSSEEPKDEPKFQQISIEI